MKFQQNPTNAINNVGEVNRGRIGRGFRHDTTFNTGDLIPVAAFHVLPGDDLSVKINTLTRTIAQPIRQTMDYLVHDTYAFYVSNYNLMAWGNSSSRSDINDFSWTRFLGEDKNGNFVRTTYGKKFSVLPTLRIEPTAGGDNILRTPRLSKYLGMNLGGTDFFHVNPFKHMAYRQIWNEYFRDWNFQAEANCKMPTSGYSSVTAVTRNLDGSLPLGRGQNEVDSVLPVNRLDDYFSRALPAPQRFSGILTTSNAGLPVFAGETFYDFFGAR